MAPGTPEAASSTTPAVKGVAKAVLVLLGVFLGIMAWAPGVQAQDKGTVAGTVKGADTGQGIGDVCVRALQGPSTAGNTTTASNGSYSLELDPGTYSMYLEDCSETRRPMYKDSGQPPPTLPATGAPLGLVLLAALALVGAGGLLVVLTRRHGSVSAGKGLGLMLVVGLVSSLSGLTVLVGAPGARAQSQQNTVTVEEGETTNFDVDLERFGGIEGTVVSAETQEPVQNVAVLIRDSNGNDVSFRSRSRQMTVGSNVTGTDGKFFHAALEAGDYTLAFQGIGPHAERAGFVYLSGSLDPDQAGSVSVAEGQMDTANQEVTTQPGSISGQVTAPSDSFICVYARHSDRRTLASGRPGDDGAYTVYGVPAGTYKVEFEDCGGGGQDTEFWDGKPDVQTADPVAVAAGQDTGGINAVMGSPGAAPTPSPVPTPAGTPTPEAPAAPAAPTTPAPPGTPAPGAPGEEIVLSSTVVRPGEEMTAVAGGFMPGSQAVGTVFSTPREVGRARADDNGVVTLTFAVPVDLEPGFHTLEIRGVDPEGRTRVVTQRFRVSGSPVLPDTGAPVLALAALGWWMLAVGLALSLDARRRRFGKRRFD